MRVCGGLECRSPLAILVGRRWWTWAFGWVLRGGRVRLEGRWIMYPQSLLCDAAVLASPLLPCQCFFLLE